VNALEYWTDYCQTSGASGQPFDIFAFGDSPKMADDLLALVLAGTKIATATRLKAYQAEGMPAPKRGDFSVVLDGEGVPACIIQATGVDILPFQDVGEDMAEDEGEGDKTLEWWRAAHLAYYERECVKEGCVFEVTEEIVCERFKVVWPKAS